MTGKSRRHIRRLLYACGMRGTVTGSQLRRMLKRCDGAADWLLVRDDHPTVD